LHQKQQTHRGTKSYKDIPIALYFDFSLSNYKLFYLFVKLAFNLLKKDTMLYIGENGDVDKVIIVKNYKLLNKEFSNEEAFTKLISGDVNGIETILLNKSTLNFLLKKYHNNKLWIFSDFDIAKKIETISPLVKVTWFCTERINYNKEYNIRIEENVNKNYQYYNEIIPFTFDNLYAYANGYGKEINNEFRERGFI